nr:PREDICTED: piggyBac transposable element-derived protein 3-like [Megachile rotundata]
MADRKAGTSKMQDATNDNQSDDYMLANRNFVVTDSDSDSESEENMNISIELLDDAQDEVFEESDSDYTDTESETESEIEQHQSELIEDTWQDDGSFIKIPFVGKPRLRKSPNGDSPYDFFELLFDNTFFSLTVNETNNYGKIIFEKKWKELTISEFKVFLSLLLHMGTIKCPRIDNYWSKSEQFGFQWFSRHMSRQRFQNILRSLRFSSDNDRLRKIIPVVDYFNNKMSEIYYPRKELSMDEFLVPWRGSLIFKQSIAKKHKRGVKLCIVCESSGTALRIKAYTGSGDDISEKEHIVFHLLKDFLNQGHSVFMNNYYSSFGLASKLLHYKTFCTGALRKTRKRNDSEVIKQELSKNEVIFRFKDNVMIGKFKDKRDVLFISNEYTATLKEYENKHKQNIVQPIALHYYNNHMKGIERKDQMLSYYSCSRKTFKWYIKLWIHLVETLVINSFNLYKTYSPTIKKLNFHDYRLEILKNLIENSGGSRTTIPKTNDHLPEILPRNKHRKVNRKICRQCYKEGKYRRSNYFCPTCVGNPGLCLGECFKQYHRLTNV